MLTLTVIIQGVFVVLVYSVYGYDGRPQGRADEIAAKRPKLSHFH